VPECAQLMIAGVSDFEIAISAGAQVEHTQQPGRMA
jgi:hypothetical protein